MLFSYELVLAWRSHQAILTYLLEDHYVRNLLSIKIIPLDLLPSGKIVSMDPTSQPATLSRSVGRLRESPVVWPACLFCRARDRMGLMHSRTHTA